MTMRAPSARQTETGNRIDQRAVDQPAAVDLHGAEDAGQRERRFQRIHQAALVEPHLVPGAELGGDRHEFPLEPLDVELLEMVLEPGAQALSGDEARAGEIDVEKAEDAAAGQPAGEVLERVEPAGDEAGAGHGADRGAGDDVGLEPGSDQAFQHADMGPAAGRAAAKGDANRRSSGTHHGQGPSRRGSGRSRPHATILLTLTGVAECDDLAADHITPNSLRFPLRHQHDGKRSLDRTVALRRRSAATHRRRARRPAAPRDRSRTLAPGMAGGVRALLSRPSARCASWSQSVRISTTRWVLPLSSPLRHSRPRERDQ